MVIQIRKRQYIICENHELHDSLLKGTLVLVVLLGIFPTPVFSQAKSGGQPMNPDRLPPLWSTGATTTGPVIELQRPIPQWTGYFEKGSPKNPNIYIVSFLRLGKNSLERGEFRLAQECFNSALSYSSQISGTYLGLGIADFELGNSDAAIKNLNMSLKLNPKSISALVFKGLVGIKTNHLNTALSDMDNAITILRHLGATHTNLKYSVAAQKKLKILTSIQKQIIDSLDHPTESQIVIDEASKSLFFDELSIEQ